VSTFSHTFANWGPYVEAWGLLRRIGADYEYNASTQSISFSYAQFDPDEATAAFIKTRLRNIIEEDGTSS
jgi:hypothetical protein